jgi:YebC/PmpR family DNA-binding regulatory protein
MSGHSKWATTKHKKAIIDSRRAKVFAKQIRAIEVAARNGGADMDGNPTLFDAVAKAKKSSMPADNIDRAIKRGAGLEAGAKDWITIMYEGYGPNGVAIMIECLSDNRNRSASEVKVAVTRNGGSMADLGSVSYLFNRKGVVIVKKDGSLTEDSILEAVLEAGAEEVNDLGEAFESQLIWCRYVPPCKPRALITNQLILLSFLPCLSRWTRTEQRRFSS